MCGSTMPSTKSMSKVMIDNRREVKSSWRSMESSEDSDRESTGSMGLIETIAELQG